MILKKNSGFTLLELLIVVALIAIIATAFLILFNPMQQIFKAQDSKKKSELNVLKNSFEDYYNDKNCYPKPNEVCYDAKDTYALLEAITCNICGSQTSPLNYSNISPYIKSLPCDPKSPASNYLYQVDSLTCPKWFKVYSELGYKNDPIIKDLGCTTESCGPKPNYGYDFGVASPNIDLEKTSSFYCFNNGRNCNSCGSSYEACNTRYSCQSYKKFYPSYGACCGDNNICPNTYFCTYIVTGTCIECGSSSNECISTGKCQMTPQSTIKSGSCT